MFERISDEELEKVIDDWTNQDWSVRYIQLERGHYEYILPIIAQAQLAADIEAHQEQVREMMEEIESIFAELGTLHHGDELVYQIENHDWQAFKKKYGV